jgi:hypothetical protein
LPPVLLVTGALASLTRACRRSGRGAIGPWDPTGREAVRSIVLGKVGRFTSYAAVSFGRVPSCPVPPRIESKHRPWASLLDNRLSVGRMRHFSRLSLFDLGRCRRDGFLCGDAKRSNAGTWIRGHSQAKARPSRIMMLHAPPSKGPKR